MGIEAINHFPFCISHLVVLIFAISTKQGFYMMS